MHVAAMRGTRFAYVERFNDPALQLFAGRRTTAAST
jgi:hypothetical protein